MPKQLFFLDNEANLADSGKFEGAGRRVAQKAFEKVTEECGRRKGDERGTACEKKGELC